MIDINGFSTESHTNDIEFLVHIDHIQVLLQWLILDFSDHCFYFILLMESFDPSFEQFGNNEGFMDGISDGLHNDLFRELVHKMDTPIEEFGWFAFIRDSHLIGLRLLQ